MSVKILSVMAVSNGRVTLCNWKILCFPMIFLRDIGSD